MTSMDDGDTWPMSQRFYQTLQQTAQVERGEPQRVSVRRYIHTLQARTKSMVSSHLSEFLNGVFSAEDSCRFFRTFLLRFAFDSNKSGDDSSGRMSLAFAAPIL